ncbi:MAG: hypothetical protein J6W06_04305 [Bacteroidales bacterium]|jgi:hypothetical protein|nr:hypothetical protein [Bacteroidales bacterium]
MAVIRKIIVFLFFALLLPVTFYAQGELSDSRESLRYNINQFGAKVNSDGFGLVYTFAQRVTYRLRRNYEVEYDYIKSLKEVKVINSYFSSYNSSVKRFILGKENSVHNIRMGYGYNWMIFEKRDKKSVSIHLQANAGFSFAFEKPIYYVMVDSMYMLNGDVNYVCSDHKFEDYYTNGVYDIVTKSPYRVGLNETKIRPGNYLKLDFSFDFAQDAMLVSAIEVGVIVDFYYKPVTIMYNQPHNFQWSLYLAYQYGRKYNPSINRDYRREQRKLGR